MATRLTRTTNDATRQKSESRNKISVMKLTVKLRIILRLHISRVCSKLGIFSPGYYDCYSTAPASWHEVQISEHLAPNA